MSAPGTKTTLIQRSLMSVAGNKGNPTVAAGKVRTSLPFGDFFPNAVCALSKQAIEPIDCHLGARFPGFLRCPNRKGL
jgi:hypothetical protein